MHGGAYRESLNLVWLDKHIREPFKALSTGMCGLFKSLSKERKQGNWLSCIKGSKKNHEFDDSVQVPGCRSSSSNSINSYIQQKLPDSSVKSINEVKYLADKIEVPAVALKDILDKTENFSLSTVIGEGPYGVVHYAVWRDGRKLAIKNMKKIDLDAKIFTQQLSITSKLKHGHLVELLGYCMENNMHLLLYELGTMGSLHDHLHGRRGAQIKKAVPKLSWHQRLRIALDAAKGLQYLHEIAEPSIVHGHIKSANILLFDGFRAKIADINLLNQAPDTTSHLHSTRILGTFGYHAPEYAMCGMISQSSDVYGFGVILLELLSGRKPVDHKRPKGQQSLVTWATPLLQSQDIEKCLDPSLEGIYCMESVAKFADVAVACLEYDPSHRPSISEVVTMLKKAMNQASNSFQANSEIRRTMLR